MTAVYDHPPEKASMDQVLRWHQQSLDELAAVSRRDADIQHQRDKLSAAERLALLLDSNSFRPIGQLHGGRGHGDNSAPGDGVITGYGTVHGRPVFVFAQDFTNHGGSVGVTHAARIARLVRMAVDAGHPIVGLYDSGGARIQEGVRALDGCGSVFREIINASGVIPQISVVLGPCAGAAAYAPALTDFVAMVRGIGMMYVTGPEVIKQVTGQQIDAQDLGGADVHGAQTGVAHLVYDDETTCLNEIRYLLSLLPSNCDALPDITETTDPPQRPCPGLATTVPADPRQPYDMHEVIEEVLDVDTFLEIQPQWATTMLCGFGRLAGQTVGVVANQPLQRAGVIDISAAEKSARFVRTCDLFNIPIISIVDVPGFMPGVEQEHGGILRHGAKLLFAYSKATVPRIQLILRKAYGGAYIVMDSLSLGADLSFAWPTKRSPSWVRRLRFRFCTDVNWASPMIPWQPGPPSRTPTGASSSTPTRPPGTV